MAMKRTEMRAAQKCAKEALDAAGMFTDLRIKRIPEIEED